MNRIFRPYKRSQLSVTVIRDSTMTPVSQMNVAISSIGRGSNVPVTAMPIKSWSLNINNDRQDMYRVTCILTEQLLSVSWLWLIGLEESV